MVFQLFSKTEKLFNLKLSLLLGLLFCFFNSYGQVNLDATTTGTTVNTCDTLFYDSGGPGSNKDAGTYEITFCPTNASDFTNVRFDFDNATNNMPNTHFLIYDGNSTAATLIHDIYDSPNRSRGRQLQATHWWAGMSGSNDGSNCLTFEIQGGSGAGWEGQIYCSSSVDPPSNDEICGAESIGLGSTISGSTTYSTRSCFGTDIVGTDNSYNYGSYWDDNTSRENIGDIFYSIIAPNSGVLRIDLVHIPLYPDDDFNARIHLLEKSNCTANCNTTSTTDYTSVYSRDYSMTSSACSSTATDCNTTVSRLGTSNYNGNLRFTQTGLTPGRQYILQIKGGHERYLYNTTNINGNVCGTPTVHSGVFELTASDGRPYVDGTTNCNLLLSPSNDEACGAEELAIECNLNNSSNIGGSLDPCFDISYQKLTGSSSASTNYSATVWYKYTPQIEEIGVVHNLTVSIDQCYDVTNASCDYNGDSTADDVSALDENNSVDVLFSLLEADSTVICSNSAIIASPSIANAGTSGAGDGSPATITFTPQANKVYYLVLASDDDPAQGEFCDFEIEIDVNEKISINDNLPALYICDHPTTSTASLEFSANGGRGTYIAYLETDSTAVASWSGGAAESSTSRIDTVTGEGVLIISNISDGESWAVTFDDGVGCTYYESGTYDYDLWCNKCDSYTKLDIVSPDTAACPNEEIFLTPVVDAAVPGPFYAGGSFSRYYDRVSGGSSRSYLYNENSEMTVSEPTISAGSAQVEEICIKLYSSFWNYLTLDMELDGCGSSVNIWTGSKVGGSDTAPGSSRGRGYQTFCITTGWQNTSYGVETGSGPVGTAPFNTAWDGCDPETPIKIASSGGRYYRYVYAYDMSVKILDYVIEPIASFKDGYALEWIPETTANTPFTPSISDGSELTYTPFTDPDSLTSTFVETVPGLYAYHLVGTDANGCEVGKDINHGGPDGQGRFQIQVYTSPTIDDVIYETPLCFGGKTDINATVTAGDNYLDPTFGYKWTITATTGDAQGFLTADNTNSTTLLTSGTGSITFNLTITDERGCSDTYSDTITINPDCTADAGQY